MARPARLHRKRPLLLLFLLRSGAAITYGIPLATVMYQLQLAGTLPGVILANLVRRCRS